MRVTLFLIYLVVIIFVPFGLVFAVNLLLEGAGATTIAYTGWTWFGAFMLCAMYLGGNKSQ